MDVCHAQGYHFYGFRGILNQLRMTTKRRHSKCSGFSHSLDRFWSATPKEAKQLENADQIHHFYIVTTYLRICQLTKVKTVFKIIVVTLGAVMICGAIALLLRVAGVVYAVSNPEINTSLFWLTDRDDTYLQRVLANGANPNEQNHQGMSAMHFAASYGSGEGIRSLLEAGGNASQQDHIGRTPLFYAADNIKGNGALTVLIDYGANVNAQDRLGLTPLFEAVKLGATMVTSGENVQLLLDAGANVHGVSADGRAVLDYAASSYYPEWGLVPIIEAGAGLNAQDNMGGTALFGGQGLYAPLENQVILLETGADPNLKNHAGYSACTYPYASEGSRSELLDQICGANN